MNDTRMLSCLFIIINSYQKQVSLKLSQTITIVFSMIWLMAPCAD